MKKIINFTFIILLLSAPANAANYNIAAVVNDEMVTQLELADRMKLVIATTGLSDNDEVKKHLAPQVMRSLIDEKLQLQAAKQYNISVEEKEFEQTINNIEKQRGKPQGSLKNYLQSKQVPFYSFRNQLESQIAWAKLVGKKVTPQVNISEDEISQLAQKKAYVINGDEEVQISTLLLPVTDPEKEENTRKLAAKLVKEIQKGASFEAIASQLSSSGGSGQQKIWVSRAELDPALSQALDKAEKNSITDPIRTPAGFQILRFHDRRHVKSAKMADAEAVFKQIILALKPDANAREVEVMMNIARHVGTNPGKCLEDNVAGIKDLEDLEIKVSTVRTFLSTMSPEVRPLVEKLKIEEVSEPFAAPDGIHLLMLCEKSVRPAEDIAVNAADRDNLRQQIFQQKIELGAMKLMRDLRRSAFVEIRNLAGNK